MTKVFISHSSQDEDFAGKLANDLKKSGNKVWLNQIKVGESIITKIEQGLQDLDYLVAVLSPHFILSGWAEREWTTKIWDEIQQKRTIVLPVLLQNCEIPQFLKDKKYADFRTNYETGLAALLEAIEPNLNTPVRSSFGKPDTTYNGWKEAPPELTVESTLNYLADNQGELKVVARTCCRWLCAEEHIMEAGGTEYNRSREKLHNLVINALKSGSSIEFIVQQPGMLFTDESEEWNERLQSHIKEAISSHELILKRLSEEEKKRYCFLMCTEITDDSLVFLYQKNQDGEKELTRLILDSNKNFKTQDNKNVKVEKIHVINPEGDNGYKLKEHYAYKRSKCITKDEFDMKTQEGLLKMNALVNGYSAHYSRSRNNSSQMLAKLACRYYNSTKDKLPSPVTIQLMVTSECTTKCKMCRHHKLHQKGELSTTEVFSVLDGIAKFGTESIILSGGEPLTRPDIFEILTYCKTNKRTQALKIGLLTNGIRRGGRGLTPSEALIIANTCEWVQVSLDSFDPVTFQTIRGGPYLESVKESLYNLEKAQMKNLEACFTIQKDNIEEVSKIKELANRVLPGSLPVRLKFAHGYGQKFICTQDKLAKAMRSFPLGENSRFNSEYIISMIAGGYYNYKNLSQGTPVMDKINALGKQKFKCQTLKFSCIIDPHGDVYPCCFLFDDNNLATEKSARAFYKIGSLRSSKTKTVIPEEVENELRKIWFNNDKLNDLRNKILPVDRVACYYCTRYFFQNELLNQLFNCFEEYKMYNSFQKFSEKLSEELGGQPAQPLWF